jgi:4-amino-4-deoxy-L-arabinose transferase-like glycosyltransferase
MPSATRASPHPRTHLDALTSIQGLFALFAGFAVLWLWHLNAVALSPPTDNIEQLTWMRGLAWGYYKHPPLPTWLMWLAAQVLGWSAWTSYLLGAACTLGATALLASVVKDSLGPRMALVSVLAVLCITFYNGRLNYYNHNTVLTVWVALSAWLWWRLLTRPHVKWWLALGAVVGLGMLTKYQMAVVCVASLWLVLRLGLWRQAVHRQGMWLALVVALLVFAPHLLWLRDQPHTPMEYAMQSSLGVHLDGPQRVNLVGLWLVDWLLNRCLLATLMVLAVAASVRWSRRQATAPHTTASAEPANANTLETPPEGNAHAHAAWHLLMAWGLVPPMFMALMGLAWGVELQLQWGTAFALWTPPALLLAMGLREQHLRATPLKVALGLFVVFQVLLVWLSYQTSAQGAHPSTPPHWRQFQAQALAHSVAEPARQLLGGPIDIISGPPAASGAVALLLPEQPKVLIDGNADISPWIDRHRLAGRRILELWAPGTGPSHAMPAMDGWHWSVTDHDPEDLDPADADDTPKL